MLKFENHTGLDNPSFLEKDDRENFQSHENSIFLRAIKNNRILVLQTILNTGLEIHKRKSSKDIFEQQISSV